MVRISSSTVASILSATVASATSSVDRATNHVDAEQFVVFLIGHNLDEPIRFPRHLCPGEDAEGKRANPHVVAALFRFRFGQADAADFRIAVGAARYVVVIERPDVLPRDAFGRDDALGRRDMRELRVRDRPG